MGLRDRIFGGTKEEEKSDSSVSINVISESIPGGRDFGEYGQVNVEDGDNWLTCNATRSRNNRFTLAWSGFNDGSFYLFDQNSLMVSGNVKRPHGGCVADNGTFLLVDSPADQDGSAFYILNAEGDQLVSEVIDDGNIIYFDITTDGEYAVMETRYPDEGLYIYDIADGERRCRVHQEVNIDALEFVKENGDWIIEIEESPGTHKRLSLDGDEI